MSDANNNVTRYNGHRNQRRAPDNNVPLAYVPVFCDLFYYPFVPVVYFMPVHHNVFFAPVNYRSLLDIPNISGMKYNTKEDYFVWYHSKGYGFYSDRKILAHILSLFPISFCELITECFFVMVHTNNPSKIVLNIGNIVRKTIDTNKTIVGLRCYNNMLAVVHADSLTMIRYCRDGYNIKTFHEITFATGPNPRGLCEFKNKIMVFPVTQETGVVQMINFRNNTEMKLQLTQPREIEYLALDQRGNFLAVAFFGFSTIYIWSIFGNRQTFKLQINNFTTALNHIHFSPDSKLVCCSTVHGQVNIFKIFEHSARAIYFTERIIFPFCSFKIFGPYRCICKFLTNTSVQVVGEDGSCHTVVYDFNGVAYLTQDSFFFLKNA